VLDLIKYLLFIVINKLILRLVGILFIFFIFTSISNLSAYAENKKNIKLMISVDWEGDSLFDGNLEAMRRFRDAFPEVKLIHFLNAAYFLQPGVDKSLVLKKIKSVIRPGDELALHIHALETLVKEAGVPFRDSETFGGYGRSQPVFGILGHDVPLSIYSEEEIRKLIKTSVKILNENGFNQTFKAFRAAGWSASPQVLNALVKEGYQIDSSAVDPEIVGSHVGREKPIYKQVKGLWNNISIMSNQAFPINTSSGSILEVPNNSGLADYLSGEEAFNSFLKMMDSFKQSSNKEPSVIFHYGFHQETAESYLYHVSIFVNSIKSFINTHPEFTLESSTFSMLDLKHTIKKASCNAIF